MLPSRRYRILIVEDEGALAETMRIALVRDGYEVDTAPNKEKGYHLLDQNHYDVVITDMRLPDGSGEELLEKSKILDPGCEVIVITAYATVENAVQMMKQGAYHYLTKPFHLEEMKILVRRACERRELGEENLRLKSRAREDELPPLVTRSPAMQRIMALIERSSQVDTTVLLLGESGVGKEIIARTIHKNSPFRNGPFVAVNCGAIPENLIEAELFGYDKGAFTGADQPKAGLFEEAQGGTLFLDEIGELPLSSQVKLLRVLQERRIRRLGGKREYEIHTRFIAATNKELGRLVRDGRFREDLYFRLNVLAIVVPPLRERREDLPELITSICERLSKKLRIPTPIISEEVSEALSRYPFPGNVRELENLLERALILHRGGPLTLASFPEEIRAPYACPELTHNEAPFPPGFKLEQYLEGIEGMLLKKALAEAQGIRTKAAQLLGLSFRQFRYKAKKHRL